MNLTFRPARLLPVLLLLASLAPASADLLGMGESSPYQGQTGIETMPGPYGSRGCQTPFSTRAVGLELEAVRDTRSVASKGSTLTITLRGSQPGNQDVEAVAYMVQHSPAYRPNEFHRSAWLYPHDPSTAFEAVTPVWGDALVRALVLLHGRTEPLVIELSTPAYACP